MYERLPLEHPNALQVFAVAVVMLAFLTVLVLLADRTPPDELDELDAPALLDLEDGPR